MTKVFCDICKKEIEYDGEGSEYKVKRLTHSLDSESGTSLKASGWKCVGQAGGLRWTGKRRPEVDLYPAQMKIRWEKEEKDGPDD